jgi:hypothetical protein
VTEKERKQTVLNVLNVWRRSLVPWASRWRGLPEASKLDTLALLGPLASLRSVRGVLEGGRVSVD